jgi:hypothetical protein
VAKIFKMSDLTYKFGTNGPKPFSPEFSIIPSTASEVSQNGSENSDKSAT